MVPLRESVCGHIGTGTADSSFLASLRTLNDDRSRARGFQIYRQSSAGDAVDGKGQLADVTLYPGDLLVMMGDMQEHFNHGIKQLPGQTIGARLNFTVRKFVDRNEVMKRKR